MLTEKRQEEILRLLTLKGSVTVQELKEYFDADVYKRQGYQSGECRISDAETGYTDVRRLSGTGRKHSGKYAEDDLS